MNFLFRLAYPIGFIAVLMGIALLWFLRLRFHKTLFYRYSLTHYLAKTYKRTQHGTWFLSFLRYGLFILLSICIAMPQLVDVRSNVEVEGIDIILVLDVSGSMSYADDKYDRRTRIDAAKQAAHDFAQKRMYDPIGIVLFAQDCVSRCPLTLDKDILSSIIKDINLGDINEQGTKIGYGIAMAVNRLRKSKATNKVIILLTDGEPTPEDLPMESAIGLAKKFNIKIYTIGVGSDKPKLVRIGFTPFRIPPVNKELLSLIAKQTGGMFFEAKRPRQLEKIYSKIDKLERTKIETSLFSHYYDISLPFLLMALFFLILELFFSTFIRLTL